VSYWPHEGWWPPVIEFGISCKAKYVTGLFHTPLSWSNCS
jgi:hypothetical protein